MDLITAPHYQTILRRYREEFNLRFKLFQKSHRAVDDQIFAKNLRLLLDCLPSEVPSNAEELIAALFTGLLELTEQDPQWKLRGTAQAFGAWLAVLPSCPELFAQAPTALLASLGNATLQLSREPGIRVEDFIRSLACVAKFCPEIKTLQTAGCVAAWIAGLAKQREQALVALEQLSEQICSALFPKSQLNGLALARQWRINPWIDHSTPTSGTIKMRICKIAGGFAGFGGTFLKIPYAEVAGEGFIVSDGSKNWRLDADVFGVSWTRTQNTAKKSLAMPIEINGLEKPFSTANNAHTVLVTIPSSLRVYLLARAYA